MFKIGEFSRLANVSIRMLRHYDKMDLLVPNEVDTFTGFRYYSADQLARAGKIQQLKALGFSLSLIKEMLDKGDSARMAELFALRQRELEEELHKVANQAKLLDRATEILMEERDIMAYNVVLKEIPARYVMSVRRVIKQYNDEGQLWGELMQEFQRQQVKPAENMLGISIYHDEEYKETDVDVEVQSSIAPGSYRDTDSVKFHEAPAVQVASVTFHGSYDQMGDVTRAIGQWIEDHDYGIDGPMFNINHVSPGQDPNPDNWVTEACYVVKKK